MCVYCDDDDVDDDALVCVFMCNYEFFFNCVPQSGQFHIVFAVGK